MCIFSNVPTSVMMFDLNGHIVDANDRCFSYHGAESPVELEKILYSESDWKNISTAVTMAKMGMPTTFKYSFVYDNKEKWAKAVANPVVDSDGSLLGVSVMGRDITLKENLINELKSMKLQEIA